MYTRQLQPEIDTLQSQIAQLQSQIAAAQARLAALGECEVQADGALGALQDAVMKISGLAQYGRNWTRTSDLYDVNVASIAL